LADPSIIVHYDFGVFLKKLAEMTKVNSGDKIDWGRLSRHTIARLWASADVRGGPVVSGCRRSNGVLSGQPLRVDFHQFVVGTGVDEMAVGFEGVHVLP